MTQQVRTFTPHRICVDTYDEIITRKNTQNMPSVTKTIIFLLRILYASQGQNVVLRLRS